MYKLIHSIAESHPTWVRGLKLNFVRYNVALSAVAPYVGAWIETFCPLSASALRHVAPYVGAWIETLFNTSGEVRA